jgi:acetoin utilization protein AcuB
MTPTIERYMSRGPYSVSSTESLERARTLMDRHAIRHLPVVDGIELVGLLSERDLAVVESIPGVMTANIEIARVMRPALSVSANMPIDEALDLMTEQRSDSVVVRDGTGIVGIFTTTDALVALAALTRGAAA